MLNLQINTKKCQFVRWWFGGGVGFCFVFGFLFIKKDMNFFFETYI